MVKSFLKKAAIFSLCLLIILPFTACKKDNDKGLKKIEVSEVTHSVFYAPQYVALNLGFFEDEGLDVSLSVGQGADSVAAAVLSGQVDIGFAGPEASVYIYNEGRENYLQIFSQLTQKDGSFLVSREKNEDFKWTDLKGKHILPGRRGGVPFMTFEYILKQNGLDTEKDLLLDNSVQFAMMTSAFSSGTGDYVTAFEPTASMLEKEGKGYIVASIGEESGEIPYTAYFASKKYIEQNEDIIQGFANAVYKAQLWCQEHTAEEIATAIEKSFPDIEHALLVTSVQSYMDIDAWCKDGVMTEKSLNRLQDVIEEAGELTKRADFSKTVNNTFAQNAIKNFNNK